MKQIGNLENGRVLLECSRDEQHALAVLATVADGKTYWPGPFGRESIDTDLQATFEAIAQWIEVKNQANQLRGLAGQIDELLGLKQNG